MCRVHVIADFDGSLTVSDTTALLSISGLEWQKCHGRADVPTWESLGKAYTDDVSHHQDLFKGQRAQVQSGHTLDVRPALKQAIEYQRSLSQVEEASAQRVITGAFTGIPERQIEIAAAQAVRSGKVKLRSGVLRLLQGMSRNEYDLEVLSVNWSRTWIKACLRTAAVDAEDLAAGQAIDRLQITANECPSISGTAAPLHNSPFVSGNGIRTSRDKLDHLLGQRFQWRDSPCVYIGDSPTDVECILAADMGICVCDRPPRSGQRELRTLLEEDGKLSLFEVGLCSSEHKHLRKSDMEPALLLCANDLNQLAARLLQETAFSDQH